MWSGLEGVSPRQTYETADNFRDSRLLEEGGCVVRLGSELLITVIFVLVRFTGCCTTSPNKGRQYNTSPTPVPYRLRVH